MLDLHAQLGAILFTKIFLLWNYPLEVTLTGYGLIVLMMNIPVYALYIKDIFGRKMPPPISVWTLWLILDVVAVSAEFGRHVFNAQLVAYTIGTALICVVLLRNIKIAWHKYWDTGAAATVGVAIFLFYSANDPRWALGFCLFGMTVATIPLLREILRGTDEPLHVWILIFVGSTFNLLDGQLLSSIWIGTLQGTIILLLLYGPQLVIRFPQLRKLTA